MNKPSKKIYFSGLNALRFIAAFLVVIHHAEQRKFFFGFDNFFDIYAIRSIGGLGVTFFFVLSGFLITYLLLKEKEVSNTVHVKKFYIRRILRIWPLYFLLVFISFFVLSDSDFFQTPRTKDISDHFFSKLFLYVFMLPNIAKILYKSVEYCSHFWSIGVEEQFYLIWPVFIKKNKNIVKLLATIFVSIILIKTSLKVSLHFYPNGLTHGIIDFLHYFRIQSMSIGGFAAYILFTNKEMFLKIIYKKATQVFVYTIIPILLYFEIHIPIFKHETYSILFALIILNISTNNNSLLKLENALFRYLGNISYGIYMYHPIALIIGIKLIDFQWQYSNLYYYLIITFITIGISTISYELFEKRFLKIKSKFAIVKT